MPISRCLWNFFSNLTFAIFLIESTTGGTTEDAPTDQNEEQVIITKFVSLENISTNSAYL